MSGERGFHYRRLPEHSALLAGRLPPDDFAFRSDSLQVWFNETTTGWRDEVPHSHRVSDEMFVVLEGAVVVEVGGERVRVGPGEFCCFPAGQVHQVVAADPPLRTLMIRAPSIDDKVT